MPAGRPVIIRDTKKCKVCENVKSIDDFHAKRLICKECRKIEDHTYYIQHRKVNVIDCTMH